MRRVRRRHEVSEFVSRASHRRSVIGQKHDWFPLWGQNQEETHSSSSSSSSLCFQMTRSFHFTLLFLALLRPVTPYPRSLPALLLAVEVPDLLHHQAPLEDQGDDWLLENEEALLRTQRGDLVARLLLPPLPGGPHHQEGGAGGGGGTRNGALTSIAGGLQAVSREKGGFGFRFGRKRWSDRR